MAESFEFTLLLGSHQEMVEFGTFIGRGLCDGDLVLLTGDLGAGKTTLAGGIGEGAAVKGPVLSPTFLTVRTHSLTGREGTFYHIDLYRVKDPWYLEGEGILEELEAGAMAVIEWAERAVGLSGFDPLEITILPSGPGRSLLIRGSQRWLWVTR